MSAPRPEPPARRALLGGLLLLSACVATEVPPPRAPGPELDPPGSPLVVEERRRGLELVPLEHPGSRARLILVSRRAIDAIRAGAPGAAAADLLFPLRIDERTVVGLDDLLQHVHEAPWARPHGAAELELRGVYRARAFDSDGLPAERRLVALRLAPGPGELARAGGVRVWLTPNDPPRVVAIQTD